jgi:5-methylcytosine-specific restriction endonuclease McrA
VGCGTDVLSTANVPRCQPCLEAWRLTPEFRASRNRIWRDKNRRRQALKLGLPTERYTTEEIAERDGFICGLCEEPVDMTLSGRNLRGPTIDHIIPISKGGPDTRVNVQLAHLRCNIIKGNRSRS